MDSITKVKNGLSRLESEIKFTDGYLALYPDDVCSLEVNTVRKLIAQESGSLSGDSIDSFVARCEGLMPATAAKLKEITVHFVSHAHIDMNWMWAFDETMAITNDTFATMLKLMDMYPDFTFSQSQASVYRIIETYNPTMFEQIVGRVKEGRWEISSSTWVEGDKNMASGESQIRQVLYTKRYFKQVFGLDYDDIQLDFEPDTFGHNLNVPAILSRLGVKYFYHCRAFDGPKLYRWQSPDGSGITCYYENGSDWYNYAVTPTRVVDSCLNELRDTKIKDVLRVYGVGDHGGGPTIRDVENIGQMASWPVFPTVKFSTYSEYFGRVDQSGVDLPVDYGEHNFVFTGCYTSQSEIKKANRQGERQLGEAEAYAALASRLSADFEYPATNITKAWENHLFNQFHDILPGSGVVETRRYSLGKFQEIAAATSSAKKQSLLAITDIVDTQSLLKIAGLSPGDHEDDLSLGAGVGFWQLNKGLSSPAVDDARYRLFVVFNPSPFIRSEVVEAVLWDMKLEGGLVVKDSIGNEVLYQLMDDDEHYWLHKYRTILFEAKDIPAMGYSSFIVYEDPAKPVDKNPIWDFRIETPFDTTLENEFVRADLDTESGALKSLLIKDGDIELVPSDGRSALFRIIDESLTTDGSMMSSWIVGNYASVEPIDHAKFNSIRRQPRERRVPNLSYRCVKGPLRNGLVWSASVRNSTLSVGVYAQRYSKSIRFDCHCDWLESGTPETFVPQLNITFPLALDGSTHVYEVPFAAVERDTRGMDLPALRWADISGTSASTGKEAGLTVMTDSKYGYRAGDDSMSISLIRGSYDPDPYPELGAHDFSLGVVPHTGGCNVGDAYREAIQFDQPLSVFQSSAHPGTLPPVMSLLEISNENIVLSSLKKAEDGGALVLRLYEVSGRDTDVDVKVASGLLGHDVEVTELDALERKIGLPTRHSCSGIRHRIPANGITTLAIESIDTGIGH